VKSLNELRTDLLGVRISAANDTLWSLGATIEDRARKALNDSIAQFRFPVTEVWTSISFDDQGAVIVLPRNADRIIGIHALVESGWGRVPVVHYRHVPTAMTNLLYIPDYAKIYDAGTGVNRLVELEYEARIREFPNDVFLGAVFTSGETGFVTVSGATPAAVYPSPGYLEVSSISDTDIREVVKYEVALPTGFTGLTRKVEGLVREWEAGSRVSLCFEGPANAVPTIMAGAQASMYGFWTAHQALYSDWKSAAGLRDLDLEDVLGLQRTEEDRAERRYRKVRKAPKPTTAQHRKRPY
jgi:hypothetical protein